MPTEWLAMVGQHVRQMYEGYGFLKNLRIPSNSKTSATCMKIKGGRVQNVIYPPALLAE